MRRVLLLALIVIAQIASGFGQAVAYRVRSQEELMARLKLAAATNEGRQSTLKSLFTAEGCTGDRLVEQAVKHEKLGNVICTLPGQTDEVIVVGAHFDKVKPGMGVTDNWSGASLLPSLLYGLNGVTRKHTYVFIGFTDEEGGMIGSRFYASHLTKEQRGKIRAVINMDTLGLGPTETWTSHSDPELIQDIVAVAVALHTSIVGMNVDGVGSTDSESFADYKIPRMTLHSVTQETWPILHSDNDQLSAIKTDDYYASYKLITVFLAYLDGKLDTSTPARESATVKAAAK